MNSPLALVLVAGGGLCLLVGGWYSVVGWRATGSHRTDAPTGSPGSSARAVRLFGAACLVIAGQLYASLGVYKAVDAEAYLRGVRLHTSFALAAPVLIVWFVALYTDLAGRRLLWIYALGAAIMIVVNLASPTTMHFSHVVEVGGIILPWGERLAQATAIPSRWPPLADYMIGLSCGVSAYALWTDSGQGSADLAIASSRRPLEAGLAVLIATVAVELLDPRRVSALPVDEFGLLAFVIVVGAGLLPSPENPEPDRQGHREADNQAQ